MNNFLGVFCYLIAEWLRCTRRDTWYGRLLDPGVPRLLESREPCLPLFFKCELHLQSQLFREIFKFNRDDVVGVDVAAILEIEAHGARVGDDLVLVLCPS